VHNKINHIRFFSAFFTEIEMIYERKQILYPTETVTILRDKIAKTGIDWKELDKALIKTQGGIAGSAVLQAELIRRKDPRIDFDGTLLNEKLKQLKDDRYNMTVGSALVIAAKKEAKKINSLKNRPTRETNEDIEDLEKGMQNVALETTSEDELEKVNASNDRIIEINAEINALQNQMKNFTPGWIDSDIDFWVRQKDKVDPIQFFDPLFVKAGYELNKTISPIATGYQRLLDYVKAIYIYYKPNGSKGEIWPPLQIMVLNETRGGDKGKKETITFASAIQSFDISVCQMGYDGKRVFGFYAIGPTFTLTPAGRAQTNYEWLRTLRRCFKYSNRGFEADYFDILSASMKSKYEIYQKDIPPLLDKAENVPELLAFLTSRLKTFVSVLNAELAKEKSSVVLSINEKLIVSVYSEEKTEPRLVTYNFRTLVAPSLKYNVQHVVVKQLTNFFTFPSNFVKTTPQEIKVPEMVESGIRGGTCFDFVAFNDEKVQEYLDEDRQDNIVILDTRGQNGVCFTRSRISESLEDNTGLFFPCLKAKHMGTAVKNLILARVTMRDFTAFVPIQDLEAITCSVVCGDGRNANWIFELKPANFTVPYSASVGLYTHSAPNGSISSNHCEPGSQKIVYRLVPIHLSTLRGLTKRVE
jgi:hypothetical protein